MREIVLPTDNLPSLFGLLLSSQTKARLIKTQVLKSDTRFRLWNILVLPIVTFYAIM